jgi:uncharacterized membrane protein
MELLSWRQWWPHGLPIIITVAIFMSLRGESKVAAPTRPRYWYFKFLSGLLLVALIAAYVFFIAPPMPLAFRVLYYLVVALIVIWSIVNWPRQRS